MPRSVGLSLSILRWIAISSVSLLTGCATFGQLDPPPTWCTSPSKKITCKAGDDIVQCHAQMKQELSRERSKRRCLQRYANAVKG
jgi:hypothetical protein